MRMPCGMGLCLRPVSAVADAPMIALGTEVMKLVVCTETECPAGQVGRPGSTACVAAEAAGIGPGAARTRTRTRPVQAGEYPFEVLS